MPLRTPTTDLPHFPPWPELLAGCARLASTIPEIVLPDHRLCVLQLRPYQMAPGWTIRAHEHSYYEANVILAGAAHAGTQTLTPGHLFVHGPHVAHHWRAEEPCLRLILGFTVEPPVSIPTPERWPHWPHLLYDVAQLLHEAVAGAPGWRDQSAARLAAILARVLTLGVLPETPLSGALPGDTLVGTVDAFLADNVRHPIQLEDIASVLGISVSSLTHRYRQATALSVGQRLLALRMERAAQLLAGSDLPLEEICAQVGITDAPYLCRLFQRYFRTTPGRYRARTQA
ncbi:MAG TPA: AraC family transcriptional regulator [Armatimonadota bacterium]|jgi:AraC-like DNA-binding protein